jgi:CheY-like chemotaxis protein
VPALFNLPVKLLLLFHLLQSHSAGTVSAFKCFAMIAHTDTNASARTSRMHILIVDDEPDGLETLQRSLRIKGHSVWAVTSGQEALEVLAKSGVAADMVVTDYLMPHMNGIELLTAVRSKYGQLPVVLVTAYGSKKVLTEALQNGCNGFLEKPFTPAQLQGEIERICGPAEAS